MKVLDEDRWSWMLYADGPARILSVVCGTVGLYELDIPLDAAEIAALETKGRSGLVTLAAAITARPGEFRHRHDAAFHARPEAIAAAAAWRRTRDGAG